MSFNKETGMYEGYIYKIINDINDKIYIGQTKRDLETRFYQHLSKTRHKEDHSILHKAIEKYGKDYFHIEKVILVEQKTEKLLLEKLNELEKIYIKKYNSLTPNGYNILKGGNYSPIEHRLHPIYKFSLEGVFIESYPSMTDALLSVNITNNKNSVINYHLKTDACAYGYLWSDSLTENPLSKYLSFKNKGRKKMRNKSYVVAKYDEENNFVKYYHSQQELLDDNLDVASSSLYRTLSSPQHKLYKNYYWFYADDPEQPDKTKIIA